MIIKIIDTQLIVSHFNIPFTWEKEIIETKKIELFSSKSYGSKSKLETIDSNLDYYAGGSDGIDFFQKTTFTIDRYLYTFKVVEGVGFSFVYDNITSIEETSINEKEYESSYKGNAVFKKQILDIEIDNQKLSESGVSVNSFDAQNPTKTHLKGFEMFIPYSNYKKLENCPTSKDRRGNYNPKYNSIFLKQENEFIEMSFDTAVSFVCFEDGESLYTNPKLEFVTKKQLESLNNPKGWIEVSYDTRGYSKNSGDNLLEVDGLLVEFNEKNIISDHKDCVFVTDVNDIGRGNLTGYEYKLLIHPNFIDKIDFYYEND